VEPDEAELRIETAMADVKPHRLDSYTLKTKRLKFRLHDEEFEEIREVAERLGLSISEYFCALHRHAAKHLLPENENEHWVHPDPDAKPYRRRRRS